MNAAPWLAWALILGLFTAVFVLILAGGAWLDRVEARANRRTLTNLQRSKERSTR